MVAEPKVDPRRLERITGSVDAEHRLPAHEDTPPTAPAVERPPWLRRDEIIALIVERAHEPLVDIRIGGDSIVLVRRGATVVVMGPTGAGKSSLSIGILLAHDGPVVVLSRELPADELAARAIGMRCDEAWMTPLIGGVSPSRMQDALDPRLFVLDRKNATLAALELAIRAAKAEYPDQPVMVAVDYLQIIESGEREVRAKVADVVAKVDEIARAHRVVVLAISQMSRASSRAARNGESIGADSTDGGAESAAIERAATVTLSIGSAGPKREDGTRAVDLSIGKGRMTGGDRVLPMSYNGRTGCWRLAGEARPAADVKAERESSRGTAKQAAAELAIAGYLSKAKEPQTGGDAVRAAGQAAAIGRAALAALKLRGEAVEVHRRAKRSQAWLFWTRENAERAGIPIVETSV